MHPASHMYHHPAMGGYMMPQPQRPPYNPHEYVPRSFYLN